MKTDPKTEERIQKLYDEGFCDEEIADRIGMSKSTIGKWRKRKGLPLVFENRKRLTYGEDQQIQKYLVQLRKFRRIKRNKTIIAHEKGLTAFVMSLKHQLSQISQADLEDYIIAHNVVDLSRRNELLRTNLVTQFSIPYTRVTNLYDFASTIIAKRIFHRDGHCTNCKSIYPLRLHFLASKYNLLDENLTTLCENCYRITKR
jgi:transcriptional regulator with XRE-family HTH domain